MHLAWDLMVGLGTLLFLLSAWYWLTWIFRRRLPRSRLFLLAASGAGVASVITMEAGWVVSEVGRQPWIVYNLMKVEDAATGNTGVWITFLLVAALYIGLGRDDDPDPAQDVEAVPRPRRRRRRGPVRTERATVARSRRRSPRPGRGDRPVSERVFERANRHHGAFVAGFAATAHGCPRRNRWTIASHHGMVHP